MGTELQTDTKTVKPTPTADKSTVTPPSDSTTHGDATHPAGDGLDHIRQQTHGPGSITGSGDGAPNAEHVLKAKGGKGEDGFEIVGTDNGVPKDKSKIETLPNLKPPFNAETVADKIEEACDGGWTGIGTDEAGIFNALKGLSPDQIKAVDDKFAEKHGVKYAAKGERWGLREEFKDELSGKYLETANSILDAKNQIPAEARVNGADTLKEGSGLKPGETTRVTMADGRMYDVYVPQNAQKPLPVVMMMHGASNGHDMANGRIMEKETGMDSVAEQYGFAVVYAFNEPHKETGVFGIEQEPAAWNMAGHKNFLATDKSYDDGKYLDRVMADVGARVNVDDSRVGVAGMSDGGRAAEQYVLDRPGKFSALSIMHGTWMNNEKRPANGDGLPVLMTHGTSDYMLPYHQGEDGWFGEKGRGMMSWLASSFIPGTSESRPNQQLGVFKDANECVGNPTVTSDGSVDVTKYGDGQCKVGSVELRMVKGANHAWQDWRNEGGWYVVGMPDRTQGMSEETAKFILSHKARRSFAEPPAKEG